MVIIMVRKEKNRKKKNLVGALYKEGHDLSKTKKIQ